MWVMILNILLPALGGLLWFWGGVGDGADNGLPPLHKSWRRHVWPVVIGLFLLLNGYAWIHPIKSVLIMLGVITANSLGYGESKPWWYRVLVALALGAPFVLFNPTGIFLFSPIITLVAFIPLYMLSLRHNWMTWGVVESIVGATQGAIVLTFLTMFQIVRLILGV